MVLATHVIFTAYGFWLPNDPRGSWSDFVASWELFYFGGKATKVSTRRSLAHNPHDIQKRQQAKERMNYPPVCFDGPQARAVAMGFKEAVAETGYQVYACSVMPEHVHAVIARHDLEARRIVGHLKGRATQNLIKEGLHPFANMVLPDETFPTPWARKCWRVFLDSVEDIDRAIRYVEENPVKDGFKRQHWSFVVPFAN